MIKFEFKVTLSPALQITSLIPYIMVKVFYEALLTASILTEMCLNTCLCRDVNLDIF